MSDLIERQAAIDVLAEHEKSRGHNYTLFVDIVSECAEIIRDLPTVEAEPVRHGHWEKLHKTYGEDVDCGDYDWRCSECGKVDCHNIKVEVPYCWHCGAKMNSERREDAETH